MARYVGAAVAVAAVAMVNNAVANNHRRPASRPPTRSPPACRARRSLMAIWSAAGIALIVLMARHRRQPTRAVDRAAAAAASVHTIPTEPSAAA